MTIPLLRRLSALALVGIAFPCALTAAEYIWNGAGTTWDTTSSNWDLGPWSNGAANTRNDARFNAGTSVTVTEAIFVNKITSTGATTISGGTITLDGATNATLNNSGNGPILTSGTNSAHTLTISSILTSVASGTDGVVIAGSGTVVLSNVNTYGGITVIAGGTLKLGVDNALPTGTVLNTFGSGRTFDMAGFNQTVLNLQGSNGIIKNTGATTSTLTLNGTTTPANGAGQQITGAINLIKQGTYSQSLTGSNGALNYTGTTTVSGGALILSASNSSLTGTSGITIDGGTLASSFAGNLTLGGSVTMSSGGFMSTATNNTLSSFTFAAGQSFTSTGGTIKMDFNSDGAYDQIIGTGTGGFSLSNTELALNFTAAWDAADYAASYNLFQSFGSGSVSNLTITGYDTANYTAALSNTGVLSFAPVPEPSATALLGVAALALLRRRRRD